LIFRLKVKFGSEISLYKLDIIDKAAKKSSSAANYQVVFAIQAAQSQQVFIIRILDG
jgi:hypothetical protein